ncbi:DUF3151 domain-containing protein [Georgenia faecalis]|uniref:DUF3151 domain-containing protein n=1 Tax=Georgenia faecalis TaxID=2483799 RepID=A0ABV9D713_9MICO|nr:DUF3151 domain-containing protein [Georgenia faecalis]
MPENLLPQPAPTLLPAEEDAAVRAELEAGTDPREAAAAHPAVSLPWALLAQRELAAGDPVAAYAYARTGYHRGLDHLRRAGWRGQGPIPASHVPNQGFLIALLTLGQAAAAIGEDAEATRCADFARDADPEAGRLLG